MVQLSNRYSGGSKSSDVVQQENLPFAEPTGKHINGENGALVDPAFASNKGLPIHRWVPWIAGFSADFVRDVINKFTTKNGTILDPFAGVGTTLVEAQISGNSAVGFEINPYAALASSIKSSAFWVDIELLDQTIEELQEFYEVHSKGNKKAHSVPPSGFKTRSAFYSPAVLEKVLLIQDFISDVKQGNIRDILRLAFASTMVRYSNYSYEPSLARRASTGKNDIDDYPVMRAIEEKLRDMSSDIKWLKMTMGKPPRKAKVINGSFFDAKRVVRDGTIDLIITSPPYLNNYHYNRNTRPQVYWLGFAESPKDLANLEISNFGKYWQTVRDKNRLDLDFKLRNPDLARDIEAIASLNNERGAYGGRGWANYAVTYFNDCNRFAIVLKKVLKRGSTALVVIGNSIIQGVELATDKYFAQICEHNGLQVVSIETPRTTRVGNSIIKSSVRVTNAKPHHRLYESVVILKKR